MDLLIFSVSLFISLRLSTSLAIVELKINTKNQKAKEVFSY